MGQGRRTFLKKAIGGLTAAGATGYGANSFLNIQENVDERVQGTCAGGASDRVSAYAPMIRKVAEGEPQKINLYVIHGVERYHGADFQTTADIDWDAAVSEAEQIVSDLHESVDLKFNKNEYEFDELASSQDLGNDERLRLKKSMGESMPQSLPVKDTLSRNEFYQNLEKLGLEPATDEPNAYAFPMSWIGAGRAIPEIGDVYISPDKVETDLVDKLLAHEASHLYGLDDDYIPFFTEGEGMMGTDADRKYTEESLEEFEEVLDQAEKC